MADIAPFRGILYTPKAGDPSKLLAPPYDVISPADRAQLAALDPHNCVQLILPEPTDAAKPDSRYEHAAADLKAWLADGTLARDEVPAIYRYHQIFDVYGKEVVRKGFIARVRLQKFSEGVVLPHERTLAGPKIDRLNLFRSTHSHFSQIFGLYNDREHITDRFFSEVDETPPAIEGRTADGVLHRLWRLTNVDDQRYLIRYMSGEKVYIADGHHRYETMINYAEELRPNAVSPKASSEYGVMFFCNMDDPGLVVKPTHRVLHSWPGFSGADVLKRAPEFFKVMLGPRGNADTVRMALAGHARKQPCFAMATPDGESIAYLQLRGDLIKSSVPALAASTVLGELDVTLLHGVLLETILGVSREDQEKQTYLRYIKDWEQAYAALGEPGVQAVFFMNPTKVEQVKAVADAGQVMPQKSTFFFPKIASGLVINPVDPREEVELPPNDDAPLTPPTRLPNKDQPPTNPRLKT